ncbi:MAG: radical SAM protein [Pirellulales bacterium]|nr:radical SAM protein [Pirellulales bacterium]
MPQSTRPESPLHEFHPRSFADNRYVYPVLSRRAKGISIGVNLSLDKVCNFHCIYCQVERRDNTAAQAGSGTQSQNAVDLDRLADELDRTIELVVSGGLFDLPRFRDAPPPLRRLNDIALSGDGEPTASPEFEQVVEICAEARRRHGLENAKLVLITNASMFHRPSVRRALEVLDANNGEIWAKLDAGTEEYYRMVNRSDVPWRRILDNLQEAARTRPIVVQSLWTRIRGEPPPAAELEAFCDRLREIVSGGGRIILVQVHTIVRSPAESWAAPLTAEEIEAIAKTVRGRAGLNATAYT